MSDIERREDAGVLMQRVNRWRTAFLGLVILLVGMVLGGGVTLIAMRRQVIGRPMGPEVRSEQMLGGLRRQLRLSPEQARAIEPILDGHLERMREIRLGARPAIAEELRVMNEEIMSLLDEGQRGIWLRHLERMERDLRPGFPLHRRGGEGPGQGRGMGPGPGPRPGWHGGHGAPDGEPVGQEDEIEGQR